MTTPSKSKTFQPAAPVSRQAVTVAVGFVGGLLFTWIGIPAGAMSGAMAAVALAGAIAPSWIVGLSPVMRLVAMLTSGVSIGAAVTADTLRNVVSYPFSVTAMCVCVICMSAASAWISIRFSGWDRKTAVLAAVPGAMAYALSAVIAVGGNAPRVVTVQMMRVFFLVCLVPLAIAETGADIVSPTARPSDTLMLFAVETLIAAAFGGLLHYWKVVGGMFLGAMLVSGALHAVEIAHGRAPYPIMIVGQVLIGCWSGSRFSGFDWGRFLREAPSMLSGVAVSVLISAAFAVSASTLLGLPFGVTFLAYSPGGMEAMTVLAMALGFDPFFVAAHHLARFFMLNIGLPMTLKFWIGETGKKE